MVLKSCCEYMSSRVLYTTDKHSSFSLRRLFSLLFREKKLTLATDSSFGLFQANIRNLEEVCPLHDEEEDRECEHLNGNRMTQRCWPSVVIHLASEPVETSM